MKRKWKSLFLASNWLLLSIGTSILVVLSQPTISPAQEPAPAQIIITPGKDTTEPQTQPEATETKTPEPELSPAELARQQKLMAGDKLYEAGKIAAAEKLYREAKEPFANTSGTNVGVKEAIANPTQLPPAAKVYWREAQAGITSGLETRTMVPLQLLVEQYPEFIIGNIKYAEQLKKYGQEKTALEVLERATSLYPNQPDLLRARITALGAAKQWMQASLAARQFAILNPNNPQAPQFKQLADENLKRYKSHIRRETRGNAIANIITGALGYAFTGSLLGPFSALDSTLLLLKGEESVGRSVSKQAKKQLDLIEDKEVSAYINEIGQKLAKIAGRDEFEYEFFIIPDDSLNAFALPGGKVFINAGAIVKTNSEAELAGLIGHELSHVVLSHGFQLVTQGNLIANVTQYVPLGGTIGQLLTFDYSRDMERQADRLGTRLIVANGYAADGLRNLMVTMKKESKNSPPSWLSTHPLSGERVKYLEQLITTNGYNRYAYEGVAPHQKIQAKVKQILKEKAQKDKKDDDEKKPDES